MRRMRDANGMLAIVDAFVFFIIVASVCAALPLLASQEAVPTDPYSLILNSNLPMVATWLEGELVFSLS